MSGVASIITGALRQLGVEDDHLKVSSHPFSCTSQVTALLDYMGAG
jgi:hypothetical protein